MLVKVKACIKQHSLLCAGDKVLVACSGGTDSLALLHVLSSLKAELGIFVFAAHVDHMFRGRESVEDAEFVVEYCKRNDIESFHTQIDVPAFIHSTGQSPQEAARYLRYKYLKQVSELLGCAKIATGHHRDDQAETVLINLLRGAGGEGIQGMQPLEGGIIRPFLAVSRQEIEEYCHEKNLTPRIDATNYKVKYRRNRIRLELIPELIEKYNPNIKESLCRTACIIGAEHDFITSTADQIWPSVGRAESGRILIVKKEFIKLHTAIQRAVIRLTLVKKIGSLTGITFGHVENLIDMIKNGSVGSKLNLPAGITARCNYTELELLTEKGLISSGEKASYSALELNIPGHTAIPERGLDIEAQISDFCLETCNPFTAVFDWNRIMQPIFIRARLPGDRFNPVGLCGSKKLKEYFIDEKVPREMRDKVPIICDEQGIIWIAGYRQSAIANTTQKTKKFLKLTIIKQGDNGHD